MSKILKLYANEMIKVSRKIFYIIIVLATVLAIVGMGGIIKISDVLLVGYETEISDEDKKQAMVDELYWREEKLNEAKRQLLYEITPDNVQSYYYVALDYESIKLAEKNEIYSYLNYGISSSSKDGYLLSAIYSLSEIYAYNDLVEIINVSPARKIGEEIVIEDYGIIKPDDTYQKDFEEILNSKNYGKYIDIQNKMIEANETYTASEKRIRIENNELLRAVRDTDITSSQWSEISTAITRLSTLKVQLENGTDGSSRLTETQKEKIRQQIGEIELGLEKKASGYGSETTCNVENEKLIIYLGINVALILMILSGAMAIAEEVQSGSIKALIIAPVKRYKIFTAKLMMLVTLCIIEVIAIYVGFLISNVIYQFGACPMIFTFNGTAVCMEYYSYMLLYVMLSGVQLLAYGTIALMLSTILRNVGGALGITLGIAFAVDGVVSTIAAMVDNQVLQVISYFIPTQNFNLSGKVLSSVAGEMDYMGLLTGTVQSTNSWRFSAIYTAVFIGLMLFISYESFNKRDIK